ncbi:hypothetical protein [Inhella sp.]|uniref:hypothetical protein n=1 Tax=Inhella sp. TaxID=1921806 RepID=UPI0035AE1589
MNELQALNPVPPGLLLQHNPPGAFADAYALPIPRAVSLADYVAAFYATPLFKLERGLIGLLLRRPARDADAAALGRGECRQFSAWQVLDRNGQELLLQDQSGRTRSWLRVEPVAGGTRLVFGSAVLPRTGGGFGWGFRALLGFHEWYSRALLRAAAKHLQQL